MIDIIKNEPMNTHTNFRIGGLAKEYVVAKTTEELFEAISYAKEKGMDWFVFGGGSNLLVSDKGFDGLIIQAANRALTINETRVHAEAGAITAMVARETAKSGLAGFAWAVGVPGTIGGAIFGNAGCYGGEMKDAIVSVDALHISSGERVTLSNAECRFGYRDSLFKHERYIILGCEMKLERGDAEALMQEVEGIHAKRKASQPLGDSSAGCMFKNVEFESEDEIEKLKEEVDIPQAMLESKRISAGWLIERAGLLGRRVGGIQVSEKHGNFLINHGNATADEVAQLVSICQMEVRNRYGLHLHPEVQFVGF